MWRWKGRKWCTFVSSVVRIKPRPVSLTALWHPVHLSPAEEGGHPCHPEHLPSWFLSLPTQSPWFIWVDRESVTWLGSPEMPGASSEAPLSLFQYRNSAEVHINWYYWWFCEAILALLDDGANANMGTIEVSAVPPIGSNVPDPLPEARVAIKIQVHL
jgi:hypothetical protein